MTDSVAESDRRSAAALDVSALHPDPVRQFEIWFADAERAGLVEPNAMTLATADALGRPSARVVLLKGIERGGFLFFTDYRSRKAQDLSANPRAALTFLWKELDRQVRIGGSVEVAGRGASAAYFGTRPRGSRLGAWASEQSAVIPDRATLERAVQRYDEEFGDGDVPLPPHWGGYRVLPDEFEFWQGRENRLHDRFRYSMSGGAWRIDRLAP
ncbi:MAG: pyridoxamine 5'-phosphate oxidase [Gemmatimonadaceae bacterium]